MDRNSDVWRSTRPNKGVPPIRLGEWSGLEETNSSNPSMNQNVDRIMASEAAAGQGFQASNEERPRNPESRSAGSANQIERAATRNSNSTAQRRVLADLRRQTELIKLRDRKSTRLNSSHLKLSRMPSSA